jgi:hypothetical protein
MPVRSFNDETPTGVQVWSSPEWREAAREWFDGRLRSAGMERTGAFEPLRVRPWAAVLSAQTTNGVVWFKAAAPRTAFEVALYAIFEEVPFDNVLTPIAVDAERGWMILPDGGTVIGENLTRETLIDAMAQALRRYGELQRHLERYVSMLLTLGVEDMRPAVLPHRFDEAAAVVRAYTGDGTPEQQHDYERVVALREDFRSWCERLAASPLGASLDHDDLHAWNILASHASPRRLTLFDWGDSVIAHPFASMLVPLTFMHQQYGLAPDGSELTRLRDAYLDAFTDIAPHEELVETLELACRAAKAARALTWHRALLAFAADVPEELEEFRDAPLECFNSLLQPSFLGCA